MKSSTVVSAGEFKTHCLKLMDEVAQTRRPLVITKRGKAVARIVPVEPEASVFGAMRDTVDVSGDIVASIATDWTAEQ